MGAGDSTIEIKMSAVNAFEDSATQIGELTIESQANSISLFGSVDITRDRRGLETARELKKAVDLICLTLERESADGTLSEVVKVQELETVANPFE